MTEERAKEFLECLGNGKTIYELDQELEMEENDSERKIFERQPVFKKFRNERIFLAKSLDKLEESLKKRKQKKILPKEVYWNLYFCLNQYEKVDRLRKEQRNSLGGSKNEVKL